MLTVSFATLIALTGVNFFVMKNLMHPAVVYAGIWAIQLSGLLLFRDRFIEPSDEAIFVVVLGAAAFTIGSLFSSAAIIGRGQIMRPRMVRCDFSLFWVAAVLVAICLYGQYRIFVDFASGEDFVTTLVYARALRSIEGEDIYGLYKYGSPLALAALLMLQIKISRGGASSMHKIMFGYFLLCALFLALLSTGRGPIIFVFMLLGVVYALRVGANWQLFGLFVGALSVVFMIFWVMGRAMGKADDAATGAVGNLVDYLFSSIPALSAYLAHHPLNIIDGDWGSNTFRFFSAIMAAVGLAEKPENLVQEFIPVPHLTNLYTIYLQYIKDFGLAGVCVFLVGLGLLHGYIFRRAMNNENNEFAFYILAISYLPLVQSVFQETHFLSASSWIQFALLGLIMTTARIKKREERIYG